MLAYLDLLCAALLERNPVKIRRLLRHPLAKALPRRGEMALQRARALAAGGHLRDALVTLDAVRPTDPQQLDADRLRADIQRQLLASTPVPSGDAPDHEKGELTSRGYIPSRFEVRRLM